MIIFLDFDLTITENHSGGFPYDRHFMIFNSEKIENDVLLLLNKLASENNVFIVSQGDEQQIKNYLHLKNVKNVNVFGSSSLNPMNSISWSKIKSNYILDKLKEFDPTKSHIFLDDDLNNIFEAKKYGINAVDAKKGDPLYNLNLITS